MTTTYKVSGLTCMGCVNSVQKKLNDLPEVDSAKVSLDPPEAIVDFNTDVEETTLNNLLGKYQLSKDQTKIHDDIPEPNITTYRPLIIIVLFLIGITLLAQYPFSEFNGKIWMRHFMAGFFLAFSFFKLLNLKGFAESFAMYDIISEKWLGWGYLYPFIELALGIAYLINFQPFISHIATIIVLGIGTIGVVKSNLSKRKIKCACLGDVFNLPMSTVTIVENVSMIVMVVLMLVTMGK